MKSRGFLLLDSLITIFIVSSMALLCISVYKSVINYKEGYKLYKEETNNKIAAIYDSLGECERCEIEEDLSNLEP